MFCMKKLYITLFRPISVFCGTDNIMWNISHIQAEYYQFHTTLLWVRIMLCIGSKFFRYIVGHNSVKIVDVS